ncbi:MAG TPA: TIGR00282 family metallophosphoesterase [Bacillota bacterium]
MRILFIGDVIGRPGREALAGLLPVIKEREGPDLVLANGENVAGGKGITQETAEELFEAGVDGITLGNHAWAKREVYDYLGLESRVVRPFNYPGQAPGHGTGVVQAADGREVTLVNLCGRVFLEVYVDCPFRAASRALEEVSGRSPFLIVDFHAEATSEKAAMAHYLDGRVSAVIGTHTHVQTADERILPKGTAFITDVGMTGPRHSIIGVDRDQALERFLTQLPTRLDVARPPSRLEAVVVDLDDQTGRATGIRRLQEDEG